MGLSQLHTYVDCVLATHTLSLLHFCVPGHYFVMGDHKACIASDRADIIPSKKENCTVLYSYTSEWVTDATGIGCYQKHNSQTPGSPAQYSAVEARFPLRMVMESFEFQCLGCLEPIVTSSSIVKIHTQRMVKHQFLFFAW